MPLEVGSLQVTFEVILECPACGFCEPPGELKDRESAELKVETVGRGGLGPLEGEVVSYRCWGCGRRRYLDEAIRTRDVRLYEPEGES